eukprot:gene28969-49847_t
MPALEHRRVACVDVPAPPFVGGDGLPLLPFGAYTYGVSTPAERSVPDAEAPHGINLVAPVHYALNAVGPLPSSDAKWALLTDEPGGQGVGVGVLQEAYRFVKKLDPVRPVSMVFCCCDPRKYDGAFDVAMMDPYRVADDAAKLRKAGKPFLIYFVRSPGVFPYARGAWGEIRRLAAEAQELSSAVLFGAGDGPGVTAAAPVHAAAWAERDWGREQGLAGARQTVVAVVNAESAPRPFTVRLNTSYSGPADVLFENRQVNITEGADGLHSMRLTTPTDGGGVGFSPYPVS